VLVQELVSKSADIASKNKCFMESSEYHVMLFEQRGSRGVKPSPLLYFELHCIVSY
jgi:hypothetical protein